MARKNYEGELEQLAEVPPEAPKKSAPPAPGPLMLAPRAWAEKLGNIIKGDPRIPQSVTCPKMEHAVADKLHGWSQHEHHYQDKPLLLTQEAYDAALAAGGSYPTTPAHEPALSPVKRPKVK